MNDEKSFFLDVKMSSRRRFSDSDSDYDSRKGYEKSTSSRGYSSRSKYNGDDDKFSTYRTSKYDRKSDSDDDNNHKRYGASSRRAAVKHSDSDDDSDKNDNYKRASSSRGSRGGSESYESSNVCFFF